MARRPAFDGTRQEQVLRAILKDHEKDLTEVAGELGLSYPQFWRYVSGSVPLRSDQFAPFARAFGVSESRLIRELFPVVDEPAWNPRLEMEAAGMRPEKIAQVETTIYGHAEIDQRLVVDRAIREYLETATAHERTRSVS